MGRGAGGEDRETLVRICDLAGRTRGTGFVADDRGTVVTSHEAVDGLSRVVLHAPGERTWLAEAADLTPLPDAGVALVRTDGLGVRPLPISSRAGTGAGTYVRVAAHGWREARVLGTSAVTYTATDRFHLLGGVLELAIGTAGSEAMRLGGEASGGPVVDPVTGAVLGVVGTALHAAHPASGFAVPLRAAHGPLAALLRRNAATVPAYGADLNLAGALQLTATSVGSAGGPGVWQEPVERTDTVREFTAFAAGEALVLGLVGDPGTGRTTELAALAARRARGAEPAPTLWLRGADLRADDTSVADAVARALHQAARIVAAPTAPDGGAATPDLVARLALDAGRPLLVLLDGPEEMPPVLAHRLDAWTAASVEWLGAAGARMVVACRPEHWEQAGALYPRGVLHAAPQPRLPDAVRIGDLGPGEAETARERHGVPDGALAERDARHPLTLRLLAEVRAALPGDVAGRPDRDEVFAAHLDLMCLRIAVRVAASARPPVRGTAVRRLAARVAGQVHEAARRCLGPGQGELDRESFEETFPWRTGSASAVLTEGLLVPAGAGYRFAHEEFADWVQAAHLDLDAALYALVHRWYDGSEPETVVRLPSRPAVSAVPAGHVPPPPGSGPAPAARSLPVPRHRIGPVLEALLLLAREQGPTQLALKLKQLVEVLDRTPAAGAERDRVADAQWWAVRLLTGALLRVPDVRPYQEVLRLLADRVSRRSVREGGPAGLGPFKEFGPWFWLRLRLGEADRFDLLRRLVPADGVPGAAPGWERYLDAVDGRLAADPTGVQPLLCRWFTDERPLPVPHGAPVRPTVARAAQALLYARRTLAVDDLTEALVATEHARAEELLAQLAEDEPSALCRAVDRWAHDERPERRAAAAAHGPRVAPRVRTGADRDLLRYAALALLARREDAPLHGAALDLLIRDPRTRERHLDRALARYAADDPAPTAAALATALTTHPEPVLAAFRARLRTAGAGTADVLAALAEINTPAPARRAAALVQEHAEHHPEAAGHVAAFVERRLAYGPAARAVLFPMVTSLLRGSGHPEVRCALAPVLAAPGTRASRALRAELLDVLLAFERHAPRDLAVVDALLAAAAHGCAQRAEARTRDLVHRTGLLFARTPEGAGCFDRRLVELCEEVPGFAAQVAGWLCQAPHEWAAVVGPGARRTVESLGTPMPMRSRSAGHGSLRPA
ncbi:serine protease [Streptomyces sp. NBC_00083]|uniref:S1 family peptidase n=1 Tax=Streptomyces sp. NBC_00083 TaxID=2975647 RepID=UPI0022584DD1|nr:serine protease [Streptomyces sp. NBC_00083]MCX5386029.1 serine protease [Streptomyces sp. NBC_00083]